MAVHTKESKLNAVKDVVIFKKKKIEVADKYKITRRSLDNWIKEYQDQIVVTDEDTKFYEMEQKIKELEKENEFLKKAAAFFAKNQ